RIGFSDLNTVCPSVRGPRKTGTARTSASRRRAAASSCSLRQSRVMKDSLAKFRAMAEWRNCMADTGVPGKSIHRPDAILTGLDRWHRRHARDLPWRIGPAARDAGEKPDPYLVWLSEVMLQQTTIPHAAPYFVKFRQRWPTVRKLAAAKWEDVSAAWA